MMFERHPANRLVAYHDRELSSADSQTVDAHLAACERCRAELDQIRFTAFALSRLPVVSAPDSLWESIENVRQSVSPVREFRSTGLRVAFAFSALLAVGLAIWFATRPNVAQWTVERLSGQPTAGSRRIDAIARIPAGEFLETDASSRARIRVGSIGEVELSPGSRLRLTSSRPTEYRLQLARGEIRATITAPPRLFFVDTPSATAVDLGCAYTMQIDDTGAGVLHVTSGWVALEWDSKESLVPAGAMCTTRPGIGPSIPYFEDSSAEFQAALAEGALDTILTQARVRDTLSLWHLISRVQELDRLRVFNRITALTPLPTGVTREKVLQLDGPTLKRWREELAWTW
jgi:hypothetical protein